MLRRLTRYSRIYEAHMSPALNGSSATQLFEHSNATEIRNGIIFDFYTGLPYMDVYGFDDISEMPLLEKLWERQRGSNVA